MKAETLPGFDRFSGKTTSEIVDQLKNELNTNSLFVSGSRGFNEAPSDEARILQLLQLSKQALRKEGGVETDRKSEALADVLLRNAAERIEATLRITL